MRQQRPIRFSVPFGGYKGWRQATAPWPNWAEVFWLEHLRRYAERLQVVHGPGVSLQLVDLVERCGRAVMPTGGRRWC